MKAKKLRKNKKEVKIALQADEVIENRGFEDFNLFGINNLNKSIKSAPINVDLIEEGLWVTYLISKKGFVSEEFESKWYLYKFMNYEPYAQYNS